MEMRDRIKAIRTHKDINMTQAEFSVSLGLAPTSAASWEKKANPQTPTESMRILICEKFGINREWLETGKGDMFQPQPQDDQALVDQLVRAYHGSPILRAILTTYLQLDEPRRHLVEEILEGFAVAVAKARAEGEPEPDVGEYLTAHVVNTNPDEKAQ